MATEEEREVRRSAAGGRVSRRDRTKALAQESINEEEGKEEKTSDTSTAPPATSGFDALKLVQNLKEQNAQSVTRLRRTMSSDGSESIRGSGRRMPPGRTLSSQGSRNIRRLRSEAADSISHSMNDRYDSTDNNDKMGSSSRRRLPQRTRSAQESCLPRGAIGAQRAPRARRRPDRDIASSNNDDDHNINNGSMSGSMRDSSNRRRLPARSRSMQEDRMPPRGAGLQRPARPGRRRGDRNRAIIAPEQPDIDVEEEESVFISDSDDDAKAAAPAPIMDRSSRRRTPMRTKSMDSGMMTREGGAAPRRTPRGTRRRGSNDGDNTDVSPVRRSPGPGLMRSSTGTPPTMTSSGPGLMRSNTVNPRSNRSRGSRDTARELAAMTRERSPEITATSTGEAGHSTSLSPLRSGRRRVRGEKDREMQDRRFQSQLEKEAKQKEEAEKKKEEPWMRRRKKTVGKSTSSNNDSFNNFDEGIGGGSNHDDRGLPTLGENKNFFHTDPSFGIFDAKEAPPITTASHSDSEYEHDENAVQQKMSMSMLDIGAGKLDFSTIS